MTSSIDATCSVLREFVDRLACLGKSAVMNDLATTDLTLSQIHTLFVAGDADTPLSMNEIADAIGLSVAAAGRTVDRLVRLGFVDRREDPSDRRVKRVSITVEGRALLDAQLTVHNEIVMALVSVLPDEHRTALTQALRPIVDADVDYFQLAQCAHDPSTRNQKVIS